MDLSKILSISGKPGLYQVVSQGKNTVIVESLIDKKRFPVFGHEKMSTLEEISIFTTGEDLPLKDLIKVFYEKLDKQSAPDPKTSNNQSLKDFFEKHLPDYDRERVYVSDMKKILKWYNLLLENELVDFSEEEGEEVKEEEVKEEEVKEEEVKEEEVKEEEDKDNPEAS